MKTPHLLTLLLLALTGCTAADRATEAVCTTSKELAVALIEKSNLNSTTASIDGEIADPTYTVDAQYVQGIHMEIRTRGIRLHGAIAASGQGPDKPLSPETIAALRKRGLSPDAIEELQRAILEAAQRQPSP